MMPIHKVQVSEYECVHCGYRWINRVNGKDRPMPKNCAKCKRFHWNGKGEGLGYNPITPPERSMRVRLNKYEGYYFAETRHYEPNELCKKFIDLNPRPTMQELYDALYPLKYDTWKNRRKQLIPDPDPNRPHRPGFINLKKDVSGWIPDPDREGWLKWNPDPNFKSDWIKTIEEETRLRREFMKKAIESRGEKVPKEKTFNEMMEELGQKILEAGKILEKENAIPKNKICEKLMQDFGGLAGRMIDIEKLCPPEWKGGLTEKDELIQNAILIMGKRYEKEKKVPKNKIFEKLKEKLGTHVSESDIEKFCLPEWKESKNKKLQGKEKK